MWKRAGQEERVRLGPVEVQAGATDDAWWVVDGQQRLTSLVAGLRNPDPFDPDDPFVVYYDLKSGDKRSEFFRPNRLRRRTPYCIPMARCYEAAEFQQWLFEFVEQTDRRDLIARASDVATRIRNYRVPVYVVETEDVDVVRQIFLRTNRAGRRLDLHEVFAALVPSTLSSRTRPDTIAEGLSITYGPLEPNVVAKAAKAIVSNDVTRMDEIPVGMNSQTLMLRAERALERALGFIRGTGVPHLRLLPYIPTPVVTLARFFDRFPEPSLRNSRLLRRWLWRGFFGGGLASDARTFRRAVVAVGPDEEASVQALLSQVDKNPSYELPGAFDARNSSARLVALCLASRVPSPLSWRTAEGLFGGEEEPQSDVFDWLQQHGVGAFSRLSGVGGNPPAARFLTPGSSAASLRDALTIWARQDLEHPALASHLVPPEAAQSLLDEDWESFVAIRSRSIRTALEALHAAKAEPEHNDRPGLSLGNP